MPVEYRWNSGRSAADVVEQLRRKTDPVTRGEPWELSVEAHPKGGWWFTLSHYHFGKKSIAYRQPSLKGFIAPKESGCLITAESSYRWANVLWPVTVAIFCALMLSGLRDAAPENWTMPVVFFVILASGMARYLYIRRARKGQQLQLMDEAAQVPYTVREETEGGTQC